ncbi:arginine decarboxylase, pyruvoyl-dependent [Fundidesulfovibrio butyratiphilus]
MNGTNASMLATAESGNLVVPGRYFLGAGTGDAPLALCAFDRALLSGGVGNVNLVRLSSILPPRCRRVDPFPLPQGALVPVAYGFRISETPGEIVAAAVAIAFPTDKDHAALIMEHSGAGTAEEIEGRVRRMAAENIEHRGLRVESVLSLSIQHHVERVGCAFACVVLIP